MKKILGKQEYKAMSIKEMKVGKWRTVGIEERGTQREIRDQEPPEIRSVGEFAESQEGPRAQDAVADS